MDLGPHAAFIWSAYAALVIALGGLIAWLRYDGVRLERALRDFEARGVRRRSAGGKQDRDRPMSS